MVNQRSEEQATTDIPNRPRTSKERKLHYVVRVSHRKPRRVDQAVQSEGAKRPAPRPSNMELLHGIPLFLEQLIKTLHHENACSFWESHNAGDSQTQQTATGSEIGKSAAKHGHELLRRGLTVDQVVHGYGDLCQAITELAVEQNVPVTVSEFHTLNRCLDNAIANAVTEYTRRRDLAVSDQGTQAMNERLGSLAHELRDLLNSAMLAQKAIKSGNVGVAGTTGALVLRNYWRRAFHRRL
jgi:hypothetical protein